MDDVKSSWPLCLGLQTCYNGCYKGLQHCEVERIPKKQPQFRLKSATRLHEVGIASNRGSACHGEYVPGSCTHPVTPWERVLPEVGSLTVRRALTTAGFVTGAKS